MKFSVQKQIRFHHCDPAGIVFYPQFFYLLHEVYEDFLTHIGYPEHDLITSGVGTPIVDLQTEFVGMCRHGDLVDISLGLSRLGQASMGIWYEIYGQTALEQDSPGLKLRAKTVLVFSETPNGKAVPIPEPLRQALLPYLDPAPKALP